MHSAPRTSHPPIGGLASAVIFLVLILAAAPVLAADETPAPSFDQLKARFEQAQAAGDKAKALALAEEMNNLVEPQHYETLYAIARLHAQLGHKDLAYDWLQRAADAGYPDAFSIRGDDAFTDFRTEDRFKTLVRAVWARSYVALLERSNRDEIQKPDEIMKVLAFHPGERVADVGAGSGYFTVRVARAVGPDTPVLACDIAQEMLDYLAHRVQKEKLANVKLVKVLKDDPLLPAGGIDTVLMVDTLHYVQDKAAYAGKLKAALAPGGRVVIIDYIPKPMDQRPWGPPPEQQFSRETLDAAMAAGGLKPVAAYDFLPEQYFVVFQAK